MEVWFRCDASDRMGSGHLRRCLTLADALRDAGAQCTFLCATPRHPPDTVAAARHDWVFLDVDAGSAGPVGAEDGAPVPYSSWLPHGWAADAACCRRAIRRPVDWLVVDHYALDARWEQAMRAQADAVMAIDDLADRTHAADLLLDANFDRGAGDYDGLVPAHTERLMGSRYVLLRPEFARERATRRPRVGAPRSILVNMGGSDPDDATSVALAELDAVATGRPLAATVVLGVGAPWARRVRERAAACRFPVSVLEGIDNIAEVMKRCDLAIGAGGTGVYERLFLGLPSLVTAIAPNQRPHLRRMAAAGLFRYYEGAAELRQALKDAFSGLVPSAPDVVGNGVPRVLGAMSRRGVLLVPPVPLDVRRTFRWLQDARLRDEFLVRARPERGAHFDYWRSRLRASQEHVYSAYWDGRHVGNAGVRNVDAAERAGELWLYLGDRRDRGQGLGRRILQCLESVMRTSLGLEVARLHVATTNVAARALYAQAGYAETDGREGAAAFSRPVVRMEKRL